MALKLPDIGGHIQQHKMKLAARDQELQRKENEALGIVSGGVELKSKTIARAASDPIKMFDDDGGQEGDDSRYLPSRSSTVQANTGSIVDGDGGPPNRRGKNTTTSVTAIAKIAAKFKRGGATPTPTSNTTNADTTAASKTPMPSNARKPESKELVEASPANHWASSKSIQGPSVHARAYKALNTETNKKPKKNRAKIQKEYEDEVEYAKGDLVMSTETAVALRDQEALAGLEHERSKVQLQERGRIPKSTALVTTNATQSLVIAHADLTSPLSAINTSTGQGFSPNTTMDRTIPDPSQVPRIFDGTLTSNANALGLTNNTSVSYLSTKGGKSGPTKCLYGRKLERRLAHPLQEERPYFDVWPANNSSVNKALAAAMNGTAGSATLTNTMGATGGPPGGGESAFVRPQLLHDMEAALRARLAKLTLKYPKYAQENSVNAPQETTLSPRGWTSAMRSGKPRGELYTVNEEAAAAKTRQKSMATAMGNLKRRRVKRSYKKKAATDGGAGEGNIDGFEVDSSAKPRAAAAVGVPEGSGQVTVVENSLTTTGSNPEDANDDDEYTDEEEEEEDGEGGADMVKPLFAAETFSTVEDRFRSERVSIFSEGCKEFSNQFKSYRKLLLWFVHEFDSYMTYCHKNVMSPAAQEVFKQQTEQGIRAEISVEMQALKGTVQQLTTDLADVRKQYKDLKATGAKAGATIKEKDREIAGKDTELAEAAEGRGALLSTMERLEKELWAQKNLMEGPEKRCQELSKDLIDANDKIQRGLETIDELAKDRAGLRLRIEKLEQGTTVQHVAKKFMTNTQKLTMQNSKEGGGGGGAAVAALAVQQAELLVFKKREQELIEHLALHKSKYDKSLVKIKELTKALGVTKSDHPCYTPRPQYDEEVDDLIPQAPTTAARLLMSAVEMSGLLEAKDIAVEELHNLKDMFGSLPRNLPDVTMGETLKSTNAAVDMMANPAPGRQNAGRAPQSPQALDASMAMSMSASGGNISVNNKIALRQESTMRVEDHCEQIIHDSQCDFFPKLGLNSTVPTYLKGQGHVPNMRLKRMIVQGFCKVMWIEREFFSKQATPIDQFVSRFCTKYCPPGMQSDIFAYNLHHSMHWYAFDPIIGFTKDYVTGRMDEACFYSMQRQVRDLQEHLIKACSRSSLDFGEVASDEEQARQQATALAQANAKDGAVPEAQDLFSKTFMISALMESPLGTTKTEVQMKDLLMAIGRDCPGKDVSMKKLFDFDAGLRRFSNFLEEHYTQYLEERPKKLKDLMNRIFRCDTDDNGELSPPDVAAVIFAADPDAPVQYVDPLLATLFGVKVEDLFPDVAMHTDIKHNGCNGERQYNCEDTITLDPLTIIRRLRMYPLQHFTAPKAAKVVAHSATMIVSGTTSLDASMVKGE